MRRRTEEQISRYFAYQLRLSPQLKTTIEKGQATEEEVKRGIRYQLEEIGIGTEGAKIAEADVRAEYDRLAKEKNFIVDPRTGVEARNDIKLAETWYLKTVTLPSLEVGMKILERVKTNPDIVAAMMSMGATPQQAQQAAQEVPVAREQLARKLPALEKELETIPVGQFVPKPVAVPLPPNAQSPNTQPGTGYLVVQLTRKEPEYTFKYEEIQPILASRLLLAKNPKWAEHRDGELKKFAKDLVAKDGIKINLKQYQPLFDSFIKLMTRDDAPLPATTPNPQVPTMPTPQGTQSPATNPTPNPDSSPNSSTSVPGAAPK